MTSHSKDLFAALSELTLEQKITLLSGKDAWSTHAIPEIGLRSMTLSDGPSGIRGPKWDERCPSFTFPSASCVAATWNVDHLNLTGRLSAQEARAKNVDVVLGPTINLHRSPRGGRHFEAYSEDPYLSGVLADNYVRGVQACGVAATPKHYVANDSENERMTVDVLVEDQVLYENYLAPFSAAVRNARAWAIMASYNKINGTTATESQLLETPLRSEWNFDGVVVSDWTAVRSVSESALAAIDLAMPGPDTPWSEGLLDAVRNGQVPESVIDTKVLNILRLAQRVGALGNRTQTELPLLDTRAALREIAADGFVLLENDNILPLKPTTKSLAIIGSHAFRGRYGGGGSATTIPHDPVSPLRGLLHNAPSGMIIDSAVGFHAVDELHDLPVNQITEPSGENALRVRWLDESGHELASEIRYAGHFVAMSEPVSDSTRTLQGTTRFRADETGIHRFGIAGVGQCVLRINGSVVFDHTTKVEGFDLLEAIVSPPEVFHDISLVNGEEIDLEFEYHTHLPAEYRSFGARFGYRAPRQSPENELRHAVKIAAQSEITIVVVGTTEHVESEGYDRETLTLPGKQDELVCAIAEANPNTIVIVNAGSPIEMPWRNKVAAVLLTWFPGEEFGNALADVIYGIREPGGRLPTTWGERLADAPVHNTDPANGKLAYSEGLNIGYRAWAEHNAEPAYYFGYGQGYTSWSLSGIEAFHKDDRIIVSGSVTNVGHNVGSDVVQVYLSRNLSTVNRPRYWLAGFVKIKARPGEKYEFEIPLEHERFPHWDNGWKVEPGEFTVHLARSADLRESLTTTIIIE